ncbi:MAG TPA: SRPBCC domain-containing protein [Thermoleophilaceae bacterium]|nr:SRPBCC domain-containing protein [Thermoleophilaceae bacterium]
MRRSISRSVEIDAPPGRVWHELTDTASFPDWNPFVRRLEGELREGERIEVEIEPPDGRAMTFKPTVTAVTPNRELRWLGHLLVRGLFDGEHRFEIEDLGDGRSRLTQSERFTGLLVRAFGGTLAKTERGFDAMNRALKERVEAPA